MAVHRNHAAATACVDTPPGNTAAGFGTVMTKSRRRAAVSSISSRGEPREMNSAGGDMGDY